MADVHHEELENPEVDYETSDVNAKLLFTAIFLLIISTACTMGLSVWIYNSLETRTIEAQPTALPLLQLRPTPPSPRLQPNPIDRTSAEQDLILLRAEDENILSNYSWVDRNNGIVRIPIDRAIELLSEVPEEEEPGR